jgi:hypothetical protein
MGLLDRLFGRRRSERADGYADHGDADRGYAADDGYARGYEAPPPPAPAGRPADQQAIERYRYLLRTAPPDQVEEAHAEAFTRLTPDQRQQVLSQLAATGERPQGDDPRSLARAATRAEVRSPGTLERAFGGGGMQGRGGPGFGSIVGGSLLGTIGGLVIGTAVADALFDSGAGDGGLFGGEDDVAGADGGDGFGPEDAGYGADGDYGDHGAGGDLGGGDLGGF